MSLSDEIRAALLKQARIESKIHAEEWSSEEFQESRASGYRSGADSRTEIICKLVAALEHIFLETDSDDDPLNEIAFQALSDLKLQLGINTEKAAGE